MPSQRPQWSNNACSTDRMSTARHWHKINPRIKAEAGSSCVPRPLRSSVLERTHQVFQYSLPSSPANCLALACPPGSNCKLYSRVLAAISQEAQPVHMLSLLSYNQSPSLSLPLPLAQSLVIYNVLLARCSILIKQTQWAQGGAAAGVNKRTLYLT